MKVSEPTLPLDSIEKRMVYHLQSVLEDLLTEVSADHQVTILRPVLGEIQLRDIPSEMMSYYLSGICEVTLRLAMRLNSDIPFCSEIDPDAIYEDAQAALGLNLFRRMTVEPAPRSKSRYERLIRDWQLKVRQFRSNLERSYKVFFEQAAIAGGGATFKIPADMALWWMSGDGKLVRAFVYALDDAKLPYPVRSPFIRLRAEMRSLERFCEKVAHQYALQLRRVGQKKGAQDGKAA